MLPYFKSKLHSVYNKEREARLQASLWGDGDDTFESADFFDRGEGSLVSRGTMDAEATVRSRLAKRLQKFVFACYPWLHATSEGACYFKFSVFNYNNVFLFLKLNVNRSF